MSEDVKCHKCRFWNPTGECATDAQGGADELGRCHRYPPVRVEAEGGVSGGFEHPQVYAVSWCGEFQPTPVPPAGEE